MTIQNIDINQALENAKKALETDDKISPSVRSSFNLLLLVVTLLLNKLNINSKNSSIPPSQDPNRDKKTRKIRKDKGVKRKPGAQKGHKGSTLEKVNNPDEVEEINIDRRTIPPGNYISVGYETRQVFDIKLSYFVKEYRAEILEDSNGNQYTAIFPPNINNPTQYGNEVKAESVYMSQYQLIPLARIEDYFKDQVGLPISKGSISNFNIYAYKLLDKYEEWAKEQLKIAKVNNADETGININGKRFWLHTLTNSNVTMYYADEKRGQEAMDRMGILPFFSGVLCHDHWKSYYNYNCVHSLCNAHHLRELTWAYEQDNQDWAKKIYDLLIEINNKVNESENEKLSINEINLYKKKYLGILNEGKKECPIVKKIKGRRGRQKKTKSRNLLERLIDFEDDCLRFMKESNVPFTNNLGESDIRMTKVQQKISGCFRSLNGAQIFCRIRGYLVTCKKNNVSPTDALRILFDGKLPCFITLA